MKGSQHMSKARSPAGVGPCSFWALPTAQAAKPVDAGCGNWPAWVFIILIALGSAMWIVTGKETDRDGEQSAYGDQQVDTVPSGAMR